MSTVLRQFPEISRQGHQETAYSPAIPANIQFINLVGIAADAVLSNTSNSIAFAITVSPDGTDGNPGNVLIYNDPWQGGVHHDKTGVDVPNLVNITFGPLTQYVGYRLKIAVDIPVAMVIGATVTSLP